MANNNTTITTPGKKMFIHRAYTIVPSTTQYTISDKARFGSLTATPTINTTTLDVEYPIENGTVNDNGEQTMTGSNGGDNTTDNTTTYKEGAGETDVTAQNLITNATSATKSWTITNLAALGTNMTAAEPFGKWLYIIDATTLAYLASTGTAIEIKLGSDASNYYSLTFEDGDVVVGWNWLTSGTTNVEDLTETGTVVGDLDTFIIEITTNNATDSWNSGDVVYDLLRQWASTDLEIGFDTSFPSVNYDTLIATTQITIPSTKLNGFVVNADRFLNTDTTPATNSVDKLGDGEGKNTNEEFVYEFKDRVM